MALIKICSNPYRKNIDFYYLDENKKIWDRSTEVQLCDIDIKQGFFPFIANKIINIILELYGPASEDVQIEFEGTCDEYAVLEKVCKIHGVISNKSDKGLLSASEICPEISDIYENLRVYIDHEDLTADVSCQEGFEKLSDIFSNEIPLCIFGNYSAGKSTFINALIGHDILPSSEKVTSARIYKISRSFSLDTAAISFLHYGKNYEIILRADGKYNMPAFNADDGLLSAISDLVSLPSEDLFSRLRAILRKINDSACNCDENVISEVISVAVPFSDFGLIGEGRENLVIFDTPGSNSASNTNHYDVLLNAVGKMSNGIPVFIARSDTLDSLDNVSLCKDFIDSGKFDKRFTMLIVNQADNTEFSDDKSEIRNQKIIRKLNPFGIFFVSSILGLAAKTNGYFADSYYRKVYRTNRILYTDSSDDDYTQLYKYNSLPFLENEDNSTNDSRELLYINSGLYSVEKSIMDFVSEYSVYDKCQQAYEVISELIDSTYKSVEAVRAEKADELLVYQKKLLAMKDSIHGLLNAECLRWKNTEEAKAMKFKISLQTDIEPYYTEILTNSEREREIHIAKLDEYGVNSFKKSRKSINPFSMEARLNRKRLIDAKEMASEATADVYHNEVIVEFNKKYFNACNEIEERSKEYWQEECKKIRKDISLLVSGAHDIPADKKRQLSNIIIHYGDIVLTSDSNVFLAKENFRKWIRNPKRFSSVRISRAYHKEVEKTFVTEMKSHIENTCDSYVQSHLKSFCRWIDSFHASLEKNIADVNMEISDNVRQISELTNILDNLDSRTTVLKSYKDRIKNLIDWKNFGII